MIWSTATLRSSTDMPTHAPVACVALFVTVALAPAVVPISEMAALRPVIVALVLTVPLVAVKAPATAYDIPATTRLLVSSVAVDGHATLAVVLLPLAWYAVCTSELLIDATPEY